MRTSDITNLVSLTAIQAANAVLPLVVFPYALATVGVNEYSKLALAEAVSVVITVLTLYSFEIQGPAKLQKIDWRNNKKAVDEILSSVLCARLAIVFPAGMIAILSAYFVSGAEFAELLAYFVMVPLSCALQPNWLFQAIENNRMFSVMVVLSRVTALVLILVSVQTPSDAKLVPIVIGLCGLLAATTSLLYATVGLGYRIRPPSLTSVFGEFKEGRAIFVGNVAVAMFRDLNVVVLGSTGAGAAAISAYSLAEKLIKGVQAAARPLTQLLFPKALLALGRHDRADRESANAIWRYVRPQLAVLLVAIAVGAIVWFAVLPDDFKGDKFPHHELIVPLMFIMIPAVFFGVANFMFGVAGLNYLGHRRYLLGAISATGFLSILICVALSERFGAVGAAWAFTLAEGFLTGAVLAKYYPTCFGAGK